MFELVLPIRPPKILGTRSTLEVNLKSPPLKINRDLTIPLKTRVGIPKEIGLEGDVSQQVLLSVLQSRRRLDTDTRLDVKINTLKKLLLDKLGIEKTKGDHTRELMKILASFLASDSNI